MPVYTSYCVNIADLIMTVLYSNHSDNIVSVKFKRMNVKPEVCCACMHLTARLAYSQNRNFQLRIRTPNLMSPSRMS